MRPLALTALLTALSVAAPVLAQQQMVDPDFHPTVAQPAYGMQAGPVVAIDEAHGNFHRADGQYAPFAALLRADGYRVKAGSAPFDAGGLDASVDVMVIANAGPTPEGGSPFTEAEIAALEQWVSDGGWLLLIADHAPFGVAAEPLAARFGVGMGKGYAFARGDNGGVTTNLTYPAEAFPDHPIFTGRGADERVEAVTAFTGQSLRGPADAVVLLPITEGAREADDVTVMQQISDRLGAGQPADLVLAEMSRPALPAQAVAFSYGRGRIVVLAEAGMLSAQLIRYPDGRPDRRFGMNAAPGTPVSP